MIVNYYYHYYCLAMLVIIGIALSVCHTSIDNEIIIGYVYSVEQKEKRRGETI